MIINGETRLYGIIGYPVRHTMSPAMHNAAFAALKINAVYVPFEVEPKNLAAAVQAIRRLGIAGANITIPHKENVIPFLDGLGPEAELAGAVNTIVNKKGRLVGHNTDLFGFSKSLKEDLNFKPARKTIFIIGAGGAAKAAGYALASGGAKRIIISDVVDKKAFDLACDIELKTGCECIAIRMNSHGIQEMILNSQALVNTSPCGMKKNDPLSVDSAFLHRGLCVFDFVYNRETGLIKAAKHKGIRTQGGLNMLLYQGARSFELWTGKKAPVEIMRKALMRR